MVKKSLTKRRLTSNTPKPTRLITYIAWAVRRSSRLMWYRQGRFEEARSETLRAADAYEWLGAADELEDCKELLRGIEREMVEPVIRNGSPDGGELLILKGGTHNAHRIIISRSESGTNPD